MGDKSTYVSQYTVASDKKVYTLTISCSNIDELYSDDNKNVVDSFTIKNFKEVKGKEKEVSNNVIGKIGIGIIITAVLALTGKTVKDKKDKKGSSINEVNDLDKKSENSNNNEKIICAFCGNIVDKNYNYCNRCGKKIKQHSNIEYLNTTCGI